MAQRIFVAIDLETTGLDARTDAIIEVGAVCVAFDRAAGPFSCRVLERFVTFVDPQRPIPLRIQQLTGIHDSDVTGAPTIDHVIPELLAFVRPDVVAVVAHNAGFDFGFLQAAGVNFHRPTQDTFELASILLPGMASYSLGELTRTLEIPQPEAHRALDDAEATAQLFTYLLACLLDLPPSIGATLQACGEGVDWPPLRLFDDLGEMDGQAMASIQPPAVAACGYLDSRTPNSLLLDQNEHPQPAAPDQLEACFGEAGHLREIFGPHYEVRTGQHEMARRVLQSLNAGDHLLIEAGTGTGKSMAYLVPAALWSLANQRRVVIATNTIALQEQLLDKDLPHLTALLKALGLPPVRSTLLKGRNNYLCTRRLYHWYRGRRLTPLELRVLAKVLVWVGQTTTGDVSELFLPTHAERLIWSRICSDGATCSESRCQAIRHGVAFADFFFRARQEAESAHILIVNHALLLADIAAGGRVLPPYAHIVVDEAHHLEDAATDQLSYRIEWDVVLSLIQRLQTNGDLAQAVLMEGDRLHDHDVQRLLQQVGRRIQPAIDAIRRFAQSLLTFARQQESIRQDFNYAQRLGLDGRLRTQPAWSEMEIEWDLAGQTLRAALRQLAALLHHLEQRHWWLDEPTAALFQELQGIHDDLALFEGWLDRIMFQSPDASDHEVVCWLDVNEKQDSVSMVAAPLYVNETLESELVHHKRSVIFTGATLRTGSGFSFIRDRLGLWDVAAATVESPFDYQKSTMLYLPSDLPEPNHAHFQSAVEQAILKAALASEGATLALFTSYAQLRATADAIRAPLDRMGITVLQHGTSSRQRLLREYRKSDRAVLLGTRSFWEGIDLPGDELRCLLIVRLPFAVPSDPLVAARCADLENAFRDYTLPDAILRFRQGFGRLIRRATDRGVVVVLDSRIWRKEYGQAFIESLPQCTTRHAPLANLDAEIERWLLRKDVDLRVRT